jgi:hypothetical protein
LIFPIGFSHLPVVTSALPCDLTTTNPKRSDVLAAQSDPWYLPQVHDAFSQHKVTLGLKIKKGSKQKEQSVLKEANLDHMRKIRT